MTASAPTAMAARVSGTTEVAPAGGVRRVDDHGRCDSERTIGTAETSSMLRIAGSKERTPRSHSTMSRLPRCATYSAPSATPRRWR
jgi:hypothetical protein